MACSDRIDDLCRLADGELPDPARYSLRRHLAVCDSCRDTHRLLLTESADIGSALSGRAEVGPRRRSGVRSWIAAAALLLLAGVGLTHLHGTYASWIERRDAAAERPGSELLERSVTVAALDLPLPEYLGAISNEVGVTVTLSDEARSRLDPAPVVSIPLSSPVRLGSILGLLRRFYELEAGMRGDDVVLQ